MTLKSFNELKLEKKPYWSENMQNIINLYFENHAELQIFYTGKMIPFFTEILSLVSNNKYKALNEKTENCIYLNEKDTHYFSVEDWNKICILYLNYSFAANFTVKNGLDEINIDDIDLEKHISAENINDKSSISHEIVKAVTYFKTHQYNNKGDGKNTYPKRIMPVLLQTPHISSKLIQTINTKILIKEFRVKKNAVKNKTLDNLLNYTSFSYSVAENIFMFFISQYSLFKELNILTRENKPLSSKLNDFLEKFLPLLANYINKVKTLTQIINMNDKFMEDFIVLNMEHFPNIEAHTKRDLIKLILSYIIMHFKNNTIYHSKFDLIFKENYNKIELFESYYKSSILKLGHYFFDYFKYHSSKIFNIIQQMDANNEHLIYYIQINQIYLNNINDMYAMQKPYFHKNNKEKIDKFVINLDDDIFRYNKTCNIKVNESIKKISEESFTLTCIDEYSFIKLLDFIIKIKNIQNFTLDKKKDLQLFFSIFDLSKKSVQILYDNLHLPENANYSVLTFEILKKFTDITYVDHEDFESSLKNIHDKLLKKTLTRVFNKMTPLKYILITSINDAMTLIPFKYFIQEYFYDGRGRSYLKTISTNIQLYPILRSFIKPFKAQELNDSGWNHLKNNLNKLLKNDKIKEELRNLDNILIKNEKFQERYVQSFFAQNIDFFLDKELQVEDEEKLIEFALNNTKKNKDIWLALSSLFRYSHNKNKQEKSLKYNTIGEYCIFDATTSGLQMKSISENNPKLAEDVNVLGNSRKDFYHNLVTSVSFVREKTLYIKELIINRLTLDKQAFDNIAVNTCVLGYNSINKALFFLHDYNNVFYDINSLESMLLAFINLDFKSSLGKHKLINIIYEKIKDEISDIILNFEVLYNNLLTSIEKEFLKEIVDEKKQRFVEILLYFRHSVILNDLMINHSWTTKAIFESRNIFKNAVMTSIYNAERQSRVKHLNELLFELDQEYNYNFESIPKNYINYLVELLETCFVYSITLYVDNTFMDNVMLEICNILRDKQKLGFHKGITYTLGDFSIQYNPKELYKYDVECPSIIKETRRNQRIYIQKENTHLKQLSTKFTPNFIHSMDAFVLQEFRKLILELNDMSYRYYYLNWGSNHDSFWITYPIILPYLLKECYYRLYLENPFTKIVLDNYALENNVVLKQLKKRHDEFSKINPNFIKI